MEAKIAEIHRRIDDHLTTERADAAEIAAVKKDIEGLREDVNAIVEIQKEILALLEQSKGALKFMKWMGALVTTGAAFWAWVAGHITFTPGVGK